MKISAADSHFSKAIKLRDKNTCQRCGIQKDRMECSHVFGRRHRTIRWDTLNAKTLCHACHRWWHENPADSGRWFAERFGEWRLELLREKRDSRVKVPKTEEKDISKHYRKECKLLEQYPNHELESWQ